MSYYTSLSGDIEIEPPLTWAEVKGDENRGHTDVNNLLNNPGRNALRLVVAKYEKETDEGVLEVREGVRIEGLASDPRAGREGEVARRELQEILDRYGSPDRTFDGVIEGSGEDPLDVWRLRAFLDGGRWRAIVDTPTIAWPND